MKNQENKVLVGMSGGLDSSVSAALLSEKGYEVIGVTIEPFYFSNYYKKFTRNNPKGNIEDAKLVCDKLGIDHIVVDFFDFFKENIVDYFVKEYMEGRTPNPCVKCNPIIKWGKLLQTADQYGAKYIATGHYAMVENDNYSQRYYIKKAIDQMKDQSYFLWGLSQTQLSRTIYPLAEMRKNETRQTAVRFNLDVKEKHSSQEICFIADNNYHNFIRYAIPDIDDRIGEGDIIFNGKVIGKHQGYPFYTIGQRKGIGIIHKDPLYVKKINAKENTIEVGSQDTLYSNCLTAHSVNMVKYDELYPDRLYTAKTRFRDTGTVAKCKLIDGNRMNIQFMENKKAITPGQSIVIYEGDDLVAGGIIEAVNEQWNS